MSNKTYVEFEGFDEAIARLNKLGANVKNISEKALKKTHSIITKKADEAIMPHNETHQTEKSLRREAEIEWVGNVASVKTGFSISEGGIASIFLMYGTPRMKKDQKLYNAFWSKSTQNEIKEAQKEIFYEEIRRLNG
ncbi:MAG: hypothetical protein HFJ41_08430 [Clostridia bacterium]|nr:hypothetical protein [Clostridia bacterium]